MAWRMGLDGLRLLFLFRLLIFRENLQTRMKALVCSNSKLY